MRVLDRLPLRGLVHNLPARAKATLAVVAILGLAASAYVYATTASNLHREQEELFRDHASARIQSVEDSLQSNVALARAGRLCTRPRRGSLSSTLIFCCLGWK